MQQDPIDFAQLNELLGGDVDVDEILRELLAQSRLDFAALESALKKQDISEVTRIAHSIKGAGRMVGASSLASVFEAMELEGKQGRLKYVVEAKSELVQLMAWLEARFDPAANAGERAANP